MTLRQTLQAAPTKANELIAKLGGTSNQATKEREKLLAELGAELRLYAEFEDKQLFPVLRKHEETKSLVAEAAKANRLLIAKLAALEAAPKDASVFSEKLGELRQAFEQQLRDDRKELLPVVLKTLELEEANELAAGIEAHVNDAREGMREEAREVRAAAKRERDAEEEKAETERSSVRAQKAADRTAREAAEQAENVVRLEAAATQEAGRQIVQSVEDQVTQATHSMRAALSSYGKSAQASAADMQAVSASSALSARGLSEYGSIWTKWFGKAVQTNTDAMQRLMQCRSPQQVAEAQSAFGTNALRNWMEASASFLEATQVHSKQALKPLNDRLNPAA